MADEPERIAAKLPVSGERDIVGDDDREVIQLVEEQLTIGKRVIAGGTVRVSTRTETHDEIAEVVLDRAEVDVERVPIERAIDTAPSIRHEGDTMIVPVIEERLVVTKQLYLVEELHIRQRTTQHTEKHAVSLRRQHAVIERTDADGKALAEPSPAFPDHYTSTEPSTP